MEEEEEEEDGSEIYKETVSTAVMRSKAAKSSFHLALWMSQHPRLGGNSHLSLLDDYLLGMISRRALGVE